MPPCLRYNLFPSSVGKSWIREETLRTFWCNTISARQGDPLTGFQKLLTHKPQSDVEQATRIAQKALHAEPSNVQLRRDLASLILQQGDLRTAQAILEIHLSEENITEMKETLPLVAIAGKGREAFRCAQKAIMLDPGKLRNWQTLAYVRARETS